MSGTALLWVLLGVEAIGVAFTVAVGDRSLPAVATVAVTAGPWVAVLGLLRLCAPPTLWRYHGAEHKAVAAHETAVDMGDVAAVPSTSAWPPARAPWRCGPPPEPAVGPGPPRERRRAPAPTVAGSRTPHRSCSASTWAPAGPRRS